MKTKLCVLFGGKSVEHEISVISALQAMENLDAEKYDIIPVYISKSGDMYTGDMLRDAAAYKDLKALCKGSVRVTFVSDGGKTYFSETKEQHNQYIEAIKNNTIGQTYIPETDDVQ